MNFFTYIFVGQPHSMVTFFLFLTIMTYLFYQNKTIGNYQINPGRALYHSWGPNKTVLMELVLMVCFCIFFFCYVAIWSISAIH